MADGRFIHYITQYYKNIQLNLLYYDIQDRTEETITCLLCFGTMGILQSRAQTYQDSPTDEENAKNVLDIGEEGSNIQTITDEKVYPINAPLSSVGLDDIMLAERDGVADEIEEYCLPLLVLHFCGQTSSLSEVIL